ncbi:protein FAR-RED ELONGATED HYPOCOTYL 1-like [Carya illinoinensis]|uniref:Protein FAR-RED-ELONGATED HYPOCOTYL 1-LIKE-like n=1 Tax=Carya illinoinensis TaxID=32201 RepID=A0A8T1PD73_CARIL|nr:protein FAR-RED ELONGATED HYPOCOTYL 1-like [Carya illinoinensis]KAG6640078.1 hypothetical protein CIPAW_10G146800 [Carya illinoinensis]KAG6693038.1 hypothetical protein I3842_10G143900 [Carya illinoinensis]
MREDKENPSEIYSFHDNKGLENNTVDSNKKRKLQAGQLDFPIPKHKCWDRSFASEPVFVFDKNPEVESIFPNIITGKTEGAAMDYGAEPESGKDSNSFGGDSDSATSSYGEAKVQLKKDKLAFLSGEHPSHHDELQAFQNLEEHLVDFCDQVDYTSSGYGNNCIEQPTDNELEDILLSHRINPTNMYVLSSGRWTVGQDAQPGIRKETIDQEFEQFFSKLML